ncbi:NnrS family protein [Crenalkalicoccus roseus]|uniref:NnrS family protein n=1 Tax=Crenalkalicoccus roseus TaxID=1485588 RepID=UPI00108139C8|nr:NnrS family protein [Crenalkalicoccus roseus]
MTAHASPAAARRPAPAGLALFAHGFRPFFLMAGLWAVLGMLVWVAALHGAALPAGPLPPAQWHAHEMIAGFIGAAIAGFLLTAVPNWTGRPGYGGAPLALLAGLFVAARLALLPGSPVSPGAAAVVALLPLPALLLMVLPALAKARTPRLFGPPALVLVFWAGDLLMLGEVAGWWAAGFATGQMLSLNAALALVGLIGGRIVPSFTLNALRKAGRPAELRPLPGVDRGAMLALLAVVVVDLLAPGGALAGVVAGLAALLTALRLSRWHGLRTLGQPILWVLHLAYLMVPLALATKAAWLLAEAPWAGGWLHLQAVGAIGLMILAVMTRATLGHTGRDLVAAPPVAVAYLLLALAAPVRAFGPALGAGPGAYALAGALWIAAFGLFLAVFAPMLLRPRADGKPG